MRDTFNIPARSVCLFTLKWKEGVPGYKRVIISVTAAFEIAIIRMSRYFDVSQNAVLFADSMLPMDAFMTTRDTAEMRLVTQIFDFAKSLAEMQLSEMVLALYSAYILLQDGKIGVCLNPFSGEVVNNF